MIYVIQMRMSRHKKKWFVREFTEQWQDFFIGGNPGIDDCRFLITFYHVERRISCIQNTKDMFADFRYFKTFHGCFLLDLPWFTEYLIMFYR